MQICGTIKWRLNNKSSKIRQQAADLIARIAPVMKACDEEGLLGHLGEASMCSLHACLMELRWHISREAMSTWTQVDSAVRTHNVPKVITWNTSMCLDHTSNPINGILQLSYPLRPTLFPCALQVWCCMSTWERSTLRC